MNFRQLLTGLFFLCTTAIFAQNAPAGINYQAVARDEKGQVLTNKTISLQISLYAGEVGGKANYQEVHRIATNELGLFSLVVGKGEVLGGDFRQVPWNTMNIWMELAMDERGGNDFLPINASQLMAVPYAFHAATAGDLANGHNDDGSEKTAAFWKVNGNEMTIPGPHYLGTIDNKDLVFKTNNMERLRVGGSGDVNINNSLNVGVDINVGRDGNFGRNLNVTGIARFNNTTESNTKDDGAVIVEGGVGVEKNVNIGGNQKVGGGLTVTGTTTLNNALTVAGVTTLNNAVNANGQMTITSNVGGGDGDLAAYPLRVQGGTHGIGIKVNAGTPTGGNNFITFFDSNGGARGRVEGQTSSEKSNEPEYIYQTTINLAEVALKSANLVLSALPNACAGVGAVACPPEPSVVAICIAEEILAVANNTAYQVFAFSKIGVTYESGSADYAEWLERANVEEKVRPGEIVGVTGGKISKQTGNASQYLVISTNPAVLGNMPKEGQESRFEKVAFMGQVPVVVRGRVNVGDYILPSGLNDGTGIGVSPKLITPQQYREIVGIAWSATPEGSTLSMVNLAIGLNTNDVARLVEQQQSKIDEQQAKIAKLESSFAAMEQRMAALESGKPFTPVMAAEPAIAQTRLEYIEASVPAGFDVAQVEEAILLLEDTYRTKGIDVENHPGLKKLFHDPAFRQEIIRQVQENYLTTRSSIMKMEAARH